jgi:hypothetical protein
MNSNLESNLVVSNRKFIDNDTSEIVDKYIDEICSNSDFLCNNIDLCGNNTSIYANVENVRNICDNIKESSLIKKDEEFMRCWCLDNLQPMWGEENIRKSNKLF